MENNEKEKSNIEFLKRHAKNLYIEMVQTRLQFEDIRRQFYRTLINYNINDAKNVVVLENQLEEDVSNAQRLLNQAEERKDAFDRKYDEYVSYVFDEYGFSKNERNEIREDYSSMKSYFKKFVKLSRKFEKTEPEMGEEE